MSASRESPALTVARAHVEAWSHHDYDSARSGLAPDVHVTAITLEADFGVGKVTLPGSRLYLLDENSKIKSEHVVFTRPGNQPAAAGTRRPPPVTWPCLTVRASAQDRGDSLLQEMEGLLVVRDGDAARG